MLPYISPKENASLKYHSLDAQHPSQAQHKNRSLGILQSS